MQNHPIARAFKKRGFIDPLYPLFIYKSVTLGESKTPYVELTCYLTYLLVNSLKVGYTIYSQKAP